MNQFAGEAFSIGIKEGVKLSLSVFVILSYLKSAGLGGLKKPFFAALLTVCAASFAVVAMPTGMGGRNLVVRLIGSSFGLFYLLSLGVLFHETGTDMLGPFSRLLRSNPVLVPLVFSLSLLYYAPDMAGSSLYLADLFSMSGKPTVIVLAAAGFFAAGSAVLLVAGRTGPKIQMGLLFGLPQVLLFLAMMKLLAGGVRGFVEFSLVSSVQAGIAKLVHDVVHQTFVTIMVPDHPILTTTAWKFIGVLFGDAVSLWLSLVVFVLPLLLFIRKHFSEVPAVPPDLQGRALRRLYVKAFRDARLIKSIPAFAFLLVIVSVWFVQKGEGVTTLYNPEPKPVVADAAVLAIPLNSPGEDIRDGSLHKFLLSVRGGTCRLLVMKKPDGTLAVCLDACEVCQPDGYAQGREQLVCLYCRTPIPFDTVGKPGGCNPIPLPALVTEKEIRVEVSEILKKWRMVNSERNAENSRR